MTWEEKYKLLQEYLERALIWDYKENGYNPEDIMSEFSNAVSKALLAARIIADGEMDSVNEEDKIPVLLIKMIISLTKMEKDSEPRSGAGAGAQN